VSVTEVKMALGSWSIGLRPDTPRELLDSITPFGHIALIPGRIDPAAVGDGLLAAARYVGVYRRRDASPDGFDLQGASLAAWLGDEDGKGPITINPVVSASASFAQAVRALIPISLTEGTLVAIPGGGTWTNTSQYETARDAITYITDSYSTDTYPVSWRVNPAGTLDAGRDVDLWPSTSNPQALLTAKRRGRELGLVGLTGSMELDQDVEDYTTQVVLLAEGDGASIITASAANVSAYKDLKGQTVVITRLVSESETEATNAPARAQLQLNRFTTPRKAVTLSTSEYDVKGTFGVGDTILVHDPDTGFVDTAREVVFQGAPINPVALPVTELSWPVPAGWTVAFRTGTGAWLDLSRYYVPESGSTTIVVGGISRSLTDASSQPVGSRPQADSSIPATPAFATYLTSSYQTAAGNGETRAQIQLTWNLPLNTDGSTIRDGDHYTIRWRPNVSAPYPATWTEASGYTWNGVSANQWNQPLISPITATGWHVVYVPWGTNQVLLQEFTPGVTYEFQIQAADTASPANQSPFSSSVAIGAAKDNIPPSSPAAPEVAGSLVAIQVTHRLGVSTGGTYNLEADLDHLEVHLGGAATFFPDASTKLGKLAANSGHLIGQLPVVGTFPISTTDAVFVKVVAVDKTGNRSGASPAATVSAVLIDNAHISDLSVSKVTAGTITAAWVVGGTIATSMSGARAQMSSDGFNSYDANGVNTFRAGADGLVSMVGQLSSDTGGKRVVVNPTGASFPEIRFYPDLGSDYSTIYAVPTSISGTDESWIVLRSSLANDGYGARLNFKPGDIRLGIMGSAGTNVGGGIYADRNQLISGWFAEANATMTGGIQSGDGYSTGGSYDLDRQLRTGYYANTYGAKYGLFDTNGVFTTGIDVDGVNSWTSIKGKFLNNNVFSCDPIDGVIAGATSTGGAFASVALAYGPTMANTPHPVTSILRASVTGPGAIYQSANSATGFTQEIPNANQGTVNYWAFRT
jgi:hypothetical protein